MRREYVIFYSENHIFGNAIRRCLLDKNLTFLSRISISSAESINCGWMTGLLPIVQPRSIYYETFSFNCNTVYFLT